MKVLKIIFLYPISLIYGFVVNVRNTMYDLKMLKSKSFDIPVISIGNITVGGTGKTPTTEFLIKKLEDKYKIAILSRGYKRKTKGFILANNNSSVEDIGDEAFQVKQKFPNIIVAVDEKRVRGIEQLQKLEPKIDLIILDDAFQHRKVLPGFSILLLDYTQPFLEDKFLPYGRLRDSIKEKHRANTILVSKTPKEIKPIEMRILATNLELKAYQSLYFSTISYNKLHPVFNVKAESFDIKTLKDNKYSVLLVSGIGNFVPILSYCKEQSAEVTHVKFPDHHKYTEKDILNIEKEFNKINSLNKVIITTEKDYVKIKSLTCKNEEVKNNFYYCPIEINILNNERDDFLKQISDYIIKDKEQHRFLVSTKQY